MLLHSPNPLLRGEEEPLEEVAVGGDVEVLGDPHGGVAHEPGHVLDAGAGLGRAQVANTWRREWNVHAHRPSGRRGQPAAMAAGSKVLRR